MPGSEDILPFLWKFLYDTLYIFYIPVMLIWIFISTVSMSKSNLLGFILSGVAGAVLITTSASMGYKVVYEKAVFILIPLLALLIFSGFYHAQYKKRVTSTDPVYEKVKERIQKEVAQEKLKLHEKRGEE